MGVLSVELLSGFWRFDFLAVVETLRLPGVDNAVGRLIGGKGRTDEQRAQNYSRSHDGF